MLFASAANCEGMPLAAQMQLRQCLLPFVRTYAKVNCVKNNIPLPCDWWPEICILLFNNV